MEYWDLYTEDRVLTDKKHERGKEMPEGFYHVVVHVWLINENNEVLVTQRSKDSYRSPLKWECTCGSVLSGEDSIDAAFREVYEEVGIKLKANMGRKITSFRREFVNEKRLNDFIDVYAFKTNENYSLEKATTDEVNDCKWVNKDQLMKMFKSNEMIKTQRYILDIFKEVVND